MIHRIATILIKSRADLDEFVSDRVDWFQSTKDNPVLSCVTTMPHHTSSKPRIRVAFYRYHQGDRWSLRGKKGKADDAGS